VTTTDWYALLAARPDDWPTRLVFGDWLDERGEDAAANGQRWQASEKKHPWYSSFHYDWNWWGDGKYRSEVDYLPADLFDALPAPVKAVHHWKCWQTLADAEAALARALWSLGIVVRGQEVTT
jgi:uncharacterized protein (TIGR02996 family)